MSESLLNKLIDTTAQVLGMVEEWRDDDGEVVKQRVPFSGDADDLALLADELESAAGEIQTVADEVLKRKTDSTDLKTMLDWKDDIDSGLESLQNRTGGPEAREFIDEMFTALKEAVDGIGDSVRGRRDFYVYVHKTTDGKVFYVGKGTGKRAWSRGRHALWENYVHERLGGQYDVEIVVRDLTEREAEELEAEMIRERRDELVNWIDPSALSISLSFDVESGKLTLSGGGGRVDPDYHAKLDALHRVEGEIAKAVEEARPLEKADPERAVAILRDAVARLDELPALYPREPGLKGELMGGWMPGGNDMAPLDRLTLVLSQQGRHAELVAAVEAFTAKYQGALDSRSVGRRIMARRDKAALRSSQ